jgi:hypothetical protein
VVNDHRAAAAVAAIPLALGIALAGWFVGNALFRVRAADRYVTVKGLAEREVQADLALWPIVFTVTADDLPALEQRLDESARKIREFLSPVFSADEVGTSAPRITDRDAQGMRGHGVAGERYVAEGTVTVRTPKIDAVRDMLSRSGELVGKGVALIRSYEYNTQYLYTQLESIKPEMIAEATRDARRAAERFAQDSESEVGAIRNAQQGYFSVEDRDPFSPETKKVRVVTTIQFFLED